MTERLSALLHQEVDRLDIPVPPVREALAAGRRIRRRRRLTQVVAVAAVVSVVGAGVAAVTGGPDGRRSSDGVVADTAPTGEPVDLGPVFASGRTLYLDKGTTPIAMDEVVQAMYYTSAGLLLRTNQTGASDGGAPFHFALVGADKKVSQLDLTLGEVVPATDPREPYLAYAEMSGDVLQVVVRDVATDAEVARVDVPGTFTWGGWEAPPVALDGDLVYVGTGDVTQVVDWRTGEVTTTNTVPSGFPTVAEGRTVVVQRTSLRIVDVATGDALVEVSGIPAPWARLSTDGRYAMVMDQEANTGFDVYSVETGTHVAIDGPSWDFGWTSDGDLYSVDAAGIHECSPDTGECSDSPLPDGIELRDMVRLGGQTYES